MTDPRLPTNIRELIRAISPPWLLGALSEGFIGAVFSLPADVMNEGVSEAVKMGWLLEPTSPPDALPLIGSERRTPRYPGESLAQYRARLWGAWDAYQYGGDESAILGQLAAAGYVGVQIYDPGNASFSPAPYWSHFLVYFPLGSHAVTGVGPAWGTFNWGDGTLFGPVGLTAEAASTIRGIVAKWKPSQFICRQIIFQISGWAYGMSAAWGSFAWGDDTTYHGKNWGDPGLVWGGAIATIGP